MTFSVSVSWITFVILRLKFIWNLSPRVKLTINRHCFSCDQAGQTTLLFVHPSVQLLQLFHNVFCHRIIMKFSALITIEKSDVHSKGQSQRWKVKVTEVKTNFVLFGGFPDCNSSLNLQLVSKWCFTCSGIEYVAWFFFCFFFGGGGRHILRSHGTKNFDFDPTWAFPDCNSSLNSHMAMEWYTKFEVA